MMKNILATLLFGFLAASQVKTEDYCTSGLCDEGEKHIGCDNDGVSLLSTSLSPNSIYDFYTCRALQATAQRMQLCWTSTRMSKICSSRHILKCVSNGPAARVTSMSRPVACQLWAGIANWPRWLNSMLSSAQWNMTSATIRNSSKPLGKIYTAAASRAAVHLQWVKSRKTQSIHGHQRDNMLRLSI